MIEGVFFHHSEACGAERDLRIEILVAPFGVHIGNAEETHVVVESNVLWQRAFVLSDVPFADTLRDVPEFLERGRNRNSAIEAARFAIHRRSQNAMMQWVLPCKDC